MYIVIVEDGHTDVEVYPFMDKDAAIEYARTEAQEGAPREEDFKEHELTADMKEGGWVYFATYSESEGDCVRVVEREVR